MAASHHAQWYVYIGTPSRWDRETACGEPRLRTRFWHVKFRFLYIPIIKKSSSLSHKMKAMYFTVQFHRENILNDQQISQKHTFNGPFSARHNTVGEWDIAWWCTAYIALGRDWAELWCSAVSRLRKILYKKNLSLLLFWDVNIMGLGYSWWNMHLQIY